MEVQYSLCFQFFVGLLREMPLQPLNAPLCSLVSLCLSFWGCRGAITAFCLKQFPAAESEVDELNHYDNVAAVRPKQCAERH